jgi:hypothetical protein
MLADNDKDSVAFSPHLSDMVAEINTQRNAIKVNEHIVFSECVLKIFMDSPHGSLTVFPAV